MKKEPLKKKEKEYPLYDMITDMMVVDELKVKVVELKEENKELRDVIQSVLEYGKLYHHRKKKLKQLGFKVEGNAKGD
jgi:phage I-like protein